MAWIDGQFIPETFDDLIVYLVNGTNETLGTNYDFNTIQGTNIWKIFYPILQKCIEQQTQFAQIYENYNAYLQTIKDKVLIPKNNYIGIVENFKDELKVNASIEPATADTAGQLKVCVDQENPITEKETDKPTDEQIGNFLAKYSAAGLWFPILSGAHSYTKVLPNGAGNYVYRWVLPTEKIMNVNISYKVSRNNNLPIPDNDTIKQAFIDKFNAIYLLGQD
ncbi:MAG: hypothetical protein LBU09_01020, partial [Endomicrobium sp.]|nr:hypothetical protein [Endomicrobium sp.]